MSVSPAVILYNADGVAMAVSNGVAIPLGTTALLVAGADTGGTARFLRTHTDGTVKVDPTGTTTQPVSGPLTDTQLRATPVAVSDGGSSLTVDGSVSASIVGTVPVSGPLTDTQLRATPVPVSGPLTDTQLRASAVAISNPAFSAIAAAVPSTAVHLGGRDASGNLQSLVVNGSGSLRVDGSANTQPVSGTVTANAGTGPWPVTDNGGSLTVDGSVAVSSVGGTVAVTGPLTDTQLRAAPVPVSAASLPLPTGAATEATLSALNTKVPSQGQAAMAASLPVVIASNQTTLPVSAATLPLPTGAATEATLATRLADATFTARVNTLGQKAMVASTPVVLASDQTVIPVSDNAGSLTVDTAQLPAALVSGRLDVNVGAVPAPLSTTGGGTEAAALRVTLANDSTGLVSVDDNGASLTTDTPQLPAALVGGRLDVNSGSWLGSTSPTVGQKAMVASLPVAIASDQSAVPVSAATLPLPTGAATAANQTTLGAQTTKINDGTNTAAVTAASALKVDGSAVTQPVSAVSLPLPTGAATEATLATRLADATFTGRINTQGQKVMAASTPVVLASDQTVIPVSDNAGSLTVDTSQLPAALVGGRLDQNVGSWLGSTAPTVGQKLMTASVPVVVASDQAPIAVTFSTPSSYTGVSGAFLTLGGGTANTLQVMRATPYTEPAAAAQRSIASASANDTAAGTGARSVRITYFDGAGNGPLTETVTLNGTTPVNTVATNIRFIESMVVLTVGTGGTNAGVITLYGSTGGAGGTVGTIGTGNIVTGQGDLRTLWCHHYSPINTKVEFSTVVASIQSGGSGTNARFFLRVSLPLTANSADVPVGDILLLIGFATRSFDFHPNVNGFCRTTGYCVPGVNNATVSLAFDWQEVPV